MAVVNTAVGSVNGKPWNAPSGPQFVTPSGGRITIDAPGYDLTQPWFASFRIRVERPYLGSLHGLHNRGLMTGPRGTVEGHVHYLLKGTVTERLSARFGGEFLIARSEVDERALGAWQGPFHEVYGWVNEPTANGAEILRMFDRLTFLDEPDGVRVRTQPIPRETLYGELVDKHVPGVGFLGIYRGPDAAGLVPGWAGAKVGTGEVWRQTVDTPGGSSKPAFVHASRTTVSVLEADPLSPDDEAGRLRFLESLVEISWT